MSGGKSKVDPYYQKDPPKKKNRPDQEEELPKSYRNAVKPLRIEKGPGRKTYFYYRCEHCHEVIKTDKRKTRPRAFHDRECRDEWQRYAKPKQEFTQARRKQLSEISKKRWADPVFRKKQVEIIRGFTQTPEYRKTRSMIAKEVASRPEWKRKQSLAHKGKKRPPEVGRKISKSKMGHTVSKETRKKLADANRGESCLFWKGGVSNKRQLFYSSWEWSIQSERVKRRDDYTCQGCGWTRDDLKRAEVKKGLPVHHVIPLEEWDGDPSEYPDFLLTTMCANCHSKSDNHDGAMKWPRNSRGDKAKPENLENPRERQTSLDEF
jgi:hypothetical protein